MVETVKDLIVSLQKAPNNPKAFNYKDYSGTWHPVSTQQFLSDVQCVVAALHKIGLKKGDKVALIGPVSYFWSLCDFGIMLAGCVTVPIFHNISSDNFVYEVVQTEAKVIFVADAACHLLTQENKELFHTVIAMDDAPNCTDVVYLKDFITTGEQALKELDGVSPDVDIKPNDLATIIYTSGTTSLPKGVELTHKNLLAEAEPSKEWFDLGGQPDDCYLSYLPLAHIFGRLMNLFFTYARAPIYYLGDPMQMATASREVRPTTLIIVPRIIDKIYKSITHKINEASGLKKSLALWALKLTESENETWWWKVQSKIADHILYSKLRNLFGGRVRLVICGSAKANPKMLKFFHRIGIPIFEGYGMTEGCPVSTNREGHNRFGTIGKPMPGVELKISDTGEILIRGELIMQGYHKDPQLTATKLDAEGWYHSGDKGSIDSDGFISYQSRLTELCKTSYGEFVDIPDIERLLNELPFVDFSIMIANNRPFVTALFFPNMDTIEQIKKERHLENMSIDELLKQDFIKLPIDQALDKLNVHLNDWERIRDYRLIPVKASIEGGELSPTLKQRRQFIESKYQKFIDEMYPEHLIAINF